MGECIICHAQIQRVGWQPVQLSHRFLNAFLICLERKKRQSHSVIDQTRCLGLWLLCRYMDPPAPHAGTLFSVVSGEAGAQRMRLHGNSFVSPPYRKMWAVAWKSIGRCKGSFTSWVMCFLLSSPEGQAGLCTPCWKYAAQRNFNLKKNVVEIC